MRSRLEAYFKFTRILLVVSPIIALLSSLSSEMAAQTIDSSASSSEPNKQTVSRFEAGLQFTDVAFQPCDSTKTGCMLPPQLELGPSLGLNLTRNVAIDASLSLTPQYQADAMSYPNNSVSGGRALEFLVGPRIEVRGERLGLFLAARVGFLNWSHTLQDVNLISAPSLHYGGNDYFTAEFASGAEYALTPRTHLRVEIGDQIIDYHSASGESFSFSTPGTSTWVTGTAFVRTGVFVGIGPAIGRKSVSSRRSPPHRFFDRTNITLMTLGLLAQTSDYVTTERSFRNGSYETNGLGRPFLNQGWPGDIPVALITNSVEIGIMYGLHKMGHHRFERLPPLFIIGGSGHSSYTNVKNE